jgi:O-antigen ligase
MNKLEIIDKYAARLLMVSFFLPMIVQVQVTAAVSLYFVSRVFISKHAVPARNYKMALLIGGVYLLYLLAIPFTPHAYLSPLVNICVRMVTLLFMPFVFAIITPVFGEVIRRELIYFVYSCLILCLVGNVAFVCHYQLWQAHETLSHIQYRLFFEHATQVHPTYMSMYLCFSICILLFADQLTGRIAKVAKVALIYVLLAFLLSLLAKSPIIALVLIIAHYAYLHRKNLLKYWPSFAGLLVAVAGVYYFIPFFGQRMHEIFSFLGKGHEENISNNSFYFRELIWHEDTALLKENWLLGTGPGRMLHMLHERYFFYSISSQLSVGYPDPHNEYFSEWLSFGLLGIAVLLAVLCAHFVKAIRSKDYLYLYLILILGITFYTETVLARQRGVIFYAVFTSFFFFYNRRVAKKKAVVQTPDGSNVYSKDSKQ